MKYNRSIRNEKFVGREGFLWTTSDIEEFGRWVRKTLSPASAAKTAKDSIIVHGGRDDADETLRMQLGNVKTPFVIEFRVTKGKPSVVTLIHSIDKKEWYGSTERFELSNPASLSVGVNHLGRNFIQSVALKSGKNPVKGRLTGNADFSSALGGLLEPLERAKELLINWDDDFYITRGRNFFTSMLEIDDLKTMMTGHNDWIMTVDDTRVKNRSEYTLIFDHPRDPELSFTVDIRAIGGDRFRLSFNWNGIKRDLGSWPALFKHIRDTFGNKLERRRRKLGLPSRNEMFFSGSSEMSSREDRVGVVDFVREISRVLRDPNMRRDSILVIEPAPVAEYWNIELRLGDHVGYLTTSLDKVTGEVRSSSFSVSAPVPWPSLRKPSFSTLPSIDDDAFIDWVEDCAELMLQYI